VKSKWTPNGEYAGTVKDGGSMLCLRKAGCYRVLAEVRQVLTGLPEKFQVSSPGNLTLTYTDDDLSFAYPENWLAEEPKNKDNTLRRKVSVMPQEAHLGSWVTHGMFVGHIPKFAKYPQTLDGAFDQFSVFGRQFMGMTVATAKSLTLRDGYQGKVARYTAPSVLNAGESGWLIIVKDKADGYYWAMLFYPSNDDSGLYGQTFDGILKSFTFKK
jgi:hypothetical protein